MKRSEYYWNRKIVLGSTPTTKGLSRIESWFEKTDQRRYFVPCPHCGHMQYFRWQQFVGYKEGQPENTRYECENCKDLIEHVRKREMVECGQWRATATSIKPGLIGYHIWAAYSYSPNASWADLAREFLEVRGNRIQLQTFINTTLGETFEEDYAAAMSAEGLMARREDYAPGVVPAGVVLTMGVDVQDNRLALALWSWDVGESAALVWQAEIMGDPTAPEVWQQLDTVRRSEWRRADGTVVPVVMVGIDSGGHCTHEVYRYCREHASECVVALKGSSRRGVAVIGKGSKQDVNAAGRTIKRGVTLYQIGTDTAKTTLMGRLRHQKDGPGSFRFGEAADETFFAQLTAEKMRTRHDRQGGLVREWFCPAGKRNEQLDCLVYAYAVLLLHRRRYNAETYWQQMEDRLKKPELPSAVADADGEQREAKREARPALRSMQPAPRRNFTTSW